MRRKRPYTEPDRIKERIRVISKNKWEGCRHDCDEETMICKKCDVLCVRIHHTDLLPRIQSPMRMQP